MKMEIELNAEQKKVKEMGQKMIYEHHLIVVEKPEQSFWHFPIYRVFPLRFECSRNITLFAAACHCCGCHIVAIVVSISSFEAYTQTHKQTNKRRCLL